MNALLKFRNISRSFPSQKLCCVEESDEAEDDESFPEQLAETPKKDDD